jgi:hypothetical protein
MLNQLEPRLPARNNAEDSKTFRHATFLSERDGGCCGPPVREVRPRDSADNTPPLGAACSIGASRLDTTPGGIANFARHVKKASLGVDNPNAPAVFAIFSMDVRISAKISSERAVEMKKERAASIAGQAASTMQ